MQERPKHPIIIEGFPGFGFVGTIATEFLIKHLKAQPIGKIWSSSLMPIVAIHGGKPVDPLGVYYDKKTNIVIFHAISNNKIPGVQVDDRCLYPDAFLKEVCK